MKFPASRADGRIDIEVGVPKEPMSWLVSGVAVSRETGLGWQQMPTLVRTIDLHRSHDPVIA
jgi:hypothetical protein